MKYLIFEDFNLKSSDIDKFKKVCMNRIKTDYIT